MKQLLLLLISVPLVLISQGAGIDNLNDKPVKPGNPSISWKVLAKLSPQEYEKLTGKKLKLKEKIGLKILKWKARRMADSEPTEKQKKQGWLSLILGGVALILLFIPAGIAVLIAGGFAIAGFIIGLKSIKGNSNAPGILGIVFSSLVMLIWLIALVYVLAYGPLFI